jgi:hypothetical protein
MSDRLSTDHAAKLMHQALWGLINGMNIPSLLDSRIAEAIRAANEYKASLENK